MMGKKAKTIVLRRKDLLKRAQVQDLHRQSRNFSNCGNATSHGLFTKMEQCFTRGVLKKIMSNYSSAFITGGRSNFCSESLRSHAGSVGHKRAEDSFRIAANPQETAIPRTLRQLDKEAVSKLEKLFDNAYFVAKLEMPFTTYPHLCQLEQKHGIEPWQTYRTDKACKSFRMAISKLFKSELEEQVQRACFLSIMTDSATDAGVREVEDMYVHFLKDEEAVNAFVGLKSCSNTKAPGITEAVNSAMTDV